MLGKLLKLTLALPVAWYNSQLLKYTLHTTKYQELEDKFVKAAGGDFTLSEFGQYRYMGQEMVNLTKLAAEIIRLVSSAPDTDEPDEKTDPKANGGGMYL